MGLSALLFGMVLLAGCGQDPPAPRPQAIAVSVSQALEREVTDYVEFTGRTDAPYYVEVRARVKGYLVKVNFQVHPHPRAARPAAPPAAGQRAGGRHRPGLQVRLRRR
jgi:hypothetical protein